MKKAPYTIGTFQEYRDSYERSVRDPELFWSDIASYFYWKKPWDKMLEWNFLEPSVNWYVGGKLNITENCLDRHLEGKGSQTAILFEPNDPTGKTQKISYRQLSHEVNRAANALLEIGVKKGDRVTIYMPMVPQTLVSMLACARVGAIHSVVFGGFSAQSLSDRIRDCQSRVIITADENRRGSKTIALKALVDQAITLGCEEIVKTVVVFKNTAGTVAMKSGRDVWWHDVVDKQSVVNEAQVMDSEDPLFVLYTSGSTGKPKGVLHTCGGYMVFTGYTFANVFQYKPGEVFWCTADVGWITGHSYLAYGPLLNGATILMYEGIPTYPSASRNWEICEKHRVNILYTAPTAIRSLMASGNEFVDAFALDSLRVLGTVGEPINQEAWDWYFEKVGKKRCPVVDTWWQTETGGIMISALAGITKLKPTYASLPLPGVQPCLVGADGTEIQENNVEGLLCITHPWPSMLRTTYGDHERCRTTYFSNFPNKYFTGDAAKRDENGFYRIIGRVDDVMNVSGHRLGTAEVENAINEHPGVVESAVVGIPHAIKGTGILAFVVCLEANVDQSVLFREIRDTVDKIIGPIARPDEVVCVSGLPKTRSGKIMRRILRKIGEGDTENLGDITTLLNPEVVEEAVLAYGGQNKPKL